MITDKCKDEPVGGDLPDCDMIANTFTFSVSSWSQFALAFEGPKVTSITVPEEPVNINSQPVFLSGIFTDDNDNENHTAQWDWGDGTVTDGMVNQAGNTVAGSHAYGSTGVYQVVLTVTDDYGHSGSMTSDFVVVYDPDGGFVTGGGWIDSLAGAYKPDPSLAGRANFGFVAKYNKKQMYQAVTRNSSSRWPISISTPTVTSGSLLPVATTLSSREPAPSVDRVITSSKFGPAIMTRTHSGSRSGRKMIQVMKRLFTITVMTNLSGVDQ